MIMCREVENIRIEDAMLFLFPPFTQFQLYFTFLCLFNFYLSKLILYRRISKKNYFVLKISLYGKVCKKMFSQY